MPDGKISEDEMKIAIINSTFPRASNDFISKQVSELLNRGHQVYVYSQKRPPSNDCAEVSEEVSSRVTYTPIPYNKLKRFYRGFHHFGKAISNKPRTTLGVVNPIRFGRDALTLRPLYYLSPMSSQGEFDIIHAHWGQRGRVASIVKQSGLTGKLVTTCHGSGVREAKKRPGLYKGLFKHGDCFIANSTHTYDSLVDLGIDEEKIKHLPNPFDVSEVPFKYNVENNLRFNESNDIKLTTVADLRELKGIKYGIKAVAELQSEGVFVEYHIIGDGKESNSLKALADELDISESVTFHGHLHRQKVLEHLAQSDLFLLPSLEEGFGMVILEAQAAGLPVVATDTGGIPEALNTDAANYLVHPGDSNAIASAIADIADSRDSWPVIGEKNRQYVKNRYSLDGYLSELVKIYNNS